MITLAKNWVEERCQAVRIALQIGGFPHPGDAERLEHWLTGCIRVCHADVPPGSVRFLEDESAVVTLPRGLSREELERKRVEECGHYVLGSGLGSFMRASAGGNLRQERLARKNEGRDEAAAKRFAEAWFLPAELLRPERAHEGDEELRRWARLS